MAASEEEAPIRIRKYANRRLYNTATSSYVTLADLAQLVRDGVEFTVEDAKSGEDLTRATLTQIIVDEEQSGANLLPVCSSSTMIWVSVARVRSSPLLASSTVNSTPSRTSWARSARVT